jgi:16S rRNA processing protein RimM
MFSPQGMHIGTLVKSHGVRGEMVLRGNPLVIERLVEGMPLFIDIDGQRIPFFIEEFSPAASGEKAILKLEFIDSVDQARHYISREVYSDPSGEKRYREGMVLSEYLAYTVVDKVSGRSGTVKDYMEHEENPLLIVDMHPSEVMLPMHAAYVLSIDKEMKKIVVELPDGLL